MDDFSADIMQWATETEEWMGETIANEAKVLFSRVVTLSPREGYGRWATGHFLYNWSVGSSPQYAESLGTASSWQKIQEVNTFLNPKYFLNNKSVYLTNGTSYSNEVELVGWKKTPAYAPVTKAFASIL